jgi:hypothetical protein
MKHALVELVDGQIVSRDAEQWLHEWLARYVLQLPSRTARQEWLVDFEEKHGAADTERLCETMTALHQKGRAA